jgi:hypothetical protein
VCGSHGPKVRPFVAHFFLKRADSRY